MNPISSSLSSPVQNTFQMGTTIPASPAPSAQATASKGDTATISEEGKALAKAASDKDGDEAAAPVKSDADKAEAAIQAKSQAKVSKASALQAARIKQKLLQSKVAAAKQDAKLHPNSGASVGGLNARLLDNTRTVKIDTVQVYSS